jgi:group II intron reverse transcriptase/maturase
MGDTSRSQTISTQLQQIAEQACSYPDMVFTTLAHRITVDFLKEAHRRLRKNAAPGVDQVTAEEYAGSLDENLKALHKRLREGRYKAPPVKRVWIDKEKGKKRPIGITAFEDKIVQRAVEMLLSPIYEQMFHDCSFGYRRGRSSHQALNELREKCKQGNIGWIVSADITGLFDNINHSLLQGMIKQKVNDGGILRLIGKWLNAGVMEAGHITFPNRGTPQGSVISPILSNIFLHHVLDDWFVKEAKPRMKGRVFIIRFADDFIIGCEYEDDARRLLKVLPKRFARFELELHPEKTILVPFRRPGPSNSGKGGGTFDFLGFTHYWAKSRKGYWVIKRKTAQKKFRRTVKAHWQWCRKNRHEPFNWQYRELCSKLRGHYQYYGIRGNHRMLSRILHNAERAWRHWLSRRSHKGNIPWDKFELLRKKFPFPKPRIVHNI